MCAEPYTPLASRVHTQPNMRRPSSSQRPRVSAETLKDIVCLYCKTKRSVTTGCAFRCPLLPHLPEDPTTRLLRPFADKRVHVVIDVLNSNWQSKQIIAQLAATVHLSASHLSRLFKHDTGLSIHSFLRIRRLWHAARLLSTTEHRVSEICYNVGFSDLANFDRFFSSQFGQSPSEYRQSVQSQLLRGANVPARSGVQGITSE